jgi:imidazolonepropionase-like amidohydrolase
MYFETLALLVFNFAAPGVMQVPDTGAVTAIRAGRLIDPATGTIARNQIILVRGAKITAVGQDVPIPPGARVVDLSQ